MSKDKSHITVFEHGFLRLGQTYNNVEFDGTLLKAFQKHYGEKGVPYFTLIHNGVKFNEHVGVIQVGKTLIEVLPKADKVTHYTEDDKSLEKDTWRKTLIGMLKSVHGFEVKTTSSSHLKLKPNTILDLYFELFIKEVEGLLHKGLVKKYRKTEGNVTALKGSLSFGKHIQQNLVHQERFYVRYTSYDVEHQLHYILYKTICLLQHLNTNTALHSRIGALLLNFPEMPDIKVTEATFSKIVLNRKTQGYQKALEISKLLLLQYHPDLSKGRNDVLALMFDMNVLWEQFVYVSLRKHAIEYQVRAQVPKYFWKPEDGHRSKMIPDILITKGRENIVLDTKWKNLYGRHPSPEDLRQLFAYQHYYKAEKVALVYPGNKDDSRKGHYLHHEEQHDTAGECSVICIAVHKDNKIKEWQKEIGEQFKDWFK